MAPASVWHHANAAERKPEAQEGVSLTSRPALTAGSPAHSCALLPIGYNVESTFSAVKRKFGDAVVSRTDTAMVNEVLCKFRCQNLTCLIQEQETLGILPVFWKDEEKEDGEDRAILRLPSIQ